MKTIERGAPGETAANDELERLLGTSVRREADEADASAWGGVPVTGVLVALADAVTPLVVWEREGQPAIAARTTVDLLPEHVGCEVLMVFERGDLSRPIVVGRLRKTSAWPTKEAPPQVEVDADGRRLSLSVKEQLVLRCGQASITLTAAGKVLIQGTYVSSRSSGVNRIKGGSVQIN
jgi:hypothetical protein